MHMLKFTTRRPFSGARYDRQMLRRQVMRKEAVVSTSVHVHVHVHVLCINHETPIGARLVRLAYSPPDYRLEQQQETSHRPTDPSKRLDPLYVLRLVASWLVRLSGHQQYRPPLFNLLLHPPTFQQLLQPPFSLLSTSLFTSSRIRCLSQLPPASQPKPCLKHLKILSSA